jgi:hypothetical protein
VQAERHARREDSTQNCHMERSAAPWRSYDRLPVPWCRGTLPAILKPVAKAFKADARDIADGGPNDRYLSRFHRRGSGVPTMYALRKEFPRSTGVERANTRATARRRGRLFIGFGSENRARAGPRRRSLRPILTPSEGANDLGPKSLLVWGTDLPPRRQSTTQTRGHPTN